MDMSRFAQLDSTAWKLKQHCRAIRQHQISVAHMIFYLHGLMPPDDEPLEPAADAAKEALDELGYDGIRIWSCSTRDGGIWTPEQRHMLKYGERP